MRKWRASVWYRGSPSRGPTSLPSPRPVALNSSGFSFPHENQAEAAHSGLL